MQNLGAIAIETMATLCCMFLESCFFKIFKNISSQSVPVVFFLASAQASLCFSIVFGFTFPTWNFTDYTTTFAGG